MSDTMKAAVFEGHERIVLEERPLPHCGPNDAIVQMTPTTICGTRSTRPTTCSATSATTS
ncbi:hypothetical protein [Conexibacter sp. CPCC 206217]|uniref:hypothetical protein n=1 Tax=Conexibacter sp. CPCC 206217 TaxID=3064574 RepID=UPI002727DE5C|nr:hypothetical protein [Conexibacter sp. CPCC 206217]MDO8213573.1 hypothetical protein [Conexibacter sp. CPCC 206217]